MTAYEKVLTVRSAGRLTGQDYIDNIFDDFTELHGDRLYSDDKAVITGIAMLQGLPVTVIAHEKGRSMKDKISRNFGSAHPEGYRKALRQMKLAEKFNRPVVTFVDTSGAYCGIGAEERGQGQAIAMNLAEMSDLKVPVISVFIGDGGSGGALGIAVADEVWMMENAVYSVISPEGCASILWKDPKKAANAAQSLKLTAEDIYSFKVAEKIINELDDKKEMFEKLKTSLADTLKRLLKMPKNELTKYRYERFRKYGNIKGEK